MFRSNQTALILNWEGLRMHGAWLKPEVWLYWVFSCQI